MSQPSVNFSHIRTHEGSQTGGFEEFCCQIARHDPEVPVGSRFVRLRGAGGDGGVECLHILPDGSKSGWQSKYIWELDKEQVGKSVLAALETHPELTRYTVCVPFDLTGPNQRTRRRAQKSGLEKWDEYRSEWEALAASRGLKVEFRIAAASDLLAGCMRVDPSLGVLNYWFDGNHFGPNWFRSRLDEAVAAAGRRYNPDLDVPTPAAELLDAFARGPEWQRSVCGKADKLRDAAEHLGRGTPARESPMYPKFPEAALRHAAEAIRLCGRVEAALRRFADGDATAAVEFREAIPAAAAAAAECVSATREALVAEHGVDAPESVNFRQWMAEYQVSFPAAHFDHAKELLEVLHDLQAWMGSISSVLPGAPAMLLAGPAWSGKTHTALSVVEGRHRRGMRSIALLGHQFGEGQPWDQVRAILGVPAGLHRDALLAALNAAGEASGWPLLIVIDAINETIPRRLWSDHLASIAEAVRRYPWLKLCVTCRTTYLDASLPDGLELPRVDHAGFADVAPRAITAFFRFYGIEEPSLPWLQPEFSSPGFLRLVCETLQEDGQSRMPAGVTGLSTLVRYLVMTKETRIAKTLDYHPNEGRVHAALGALVEAMARERSRTLTWSEARAIVDTVDPFPGARFSQTLFGHLIWEGLVAEDRMFVGGAEENVVRFSFERIADYLLADKLVEAVQPENLGEAFGRSGALYFAVSDQQAREDHAGLLEAWAIILPERFGQELPNAVPGGHEMPEILLAVCNSLAWRGPEAVTEATERAVVVARGCRTTYLPAMEALLGVAARPGHPLNAEWMHAQLASMPMARRDGYWCPFLHEGYGGGAGVDRLIITALEGDLSYVTGDTAGLWATILLWFCAASDRRVRDWATKAIVRVMDRHPGQWHSLLRRFCGVDDEYVVERMLAALYGSLLRTGTEENVLQVAEFLRANLFAGDGLTANAMIRDYARLIMELALDIGCLPDVNPETFRPPYASEWPLEFPPEQFEKRIQDRGYGWRRLAHSCLHDDFSIYTVPGALSRFRKQLDLNGAKRWILRHAIELGYSERLSDFDAYLVAKYGSGRGRPEWAERVGKKYQWIALYRLIGRASDHLPPKREEWDPPTPTEPPLQALGQRDLDPTVVGIKATVVDEPAWWAPVGYDFAPSRKQPVDAWLAVRDFPDSSQMLLVTDPSSGERYYVLGAYRNWSERAEGEDRQPYRQIWMHVRSYLLLKKHAAPSWRWLKKQTFYGRWMPEGRDIHGIFVAEYPFWLPARQSCAEAEHFQQDSDRLRFPLLPTTHSLSTTYSFDASGEDAGNLLMPDPGLLHNLVQWDGDRFVDADGKSIFLYPPLVSAGPQALLVAKPYLDGFLEEHGLALAWTVLAEKQYVNGNVGGGGWAEHSRAHMLCDGAIQSSAGIDLPKPEVSKDASSEVVIPRRNPPRTRRSAR